MESTFRSFWKLADRRILVFPIQKDRGHLPDERDGDSSCMLLIVSGVETWSIVSDDQLCACGPRGRRSGRSGKILIGQQIELHIRKKYVQRRGFASHKVIMSCLPWPL